MEIEFELTVEDILVLVRRRQAYSPILRKKFRIRRYGYLLGFGLMGIGWLLNSQESLSFIFLLLAVVSFLLYPAFNDWLLKRNILREYQNENKRATLSKRIMLATPESLEEISSFGEMKVKWMAIDDISITPTHAFISTDQLPSIVIPKDKVKEKFDEFVRACQKFQEDNSN